MKKVLFLSLLFFNLISKDIVVSQICEEFHQRSYCILRLTKPINQIRITHDKKACHEINISKFSNNHILECIRKMYSQNSIEPFFQLWQELKNYKYLDDETITQEFTKMVFVLQHNLVAEHSHNTKGASFDMKLTLDGRSFTEATTVRSYYRHRLQSAIQFLKKVRCSSFAFFEQNDEECDCTFVTHHTFSNRSINACVEQMEKNQSVAPLMLLARDFANFKLIQDEIFLREFVQVVFLSLRNLYIHNAPLKYPSYRSTASIIANTYQNLDQLPLEEILEAIDLLQKELPSLFEKYEFNSKLGWKAWLKKYWWTIPTVATVMGVRIYWLFKNDTEVPSNPLLPRDN